MKISAVICTYNSEKYMEKCLTSLNFVDEIVIVDDGSVDKTVEIAKKFSKNIFHHKSVGYVEPVRNLAISKATGDWVLVVDADEEVPDSLANKLQELVKASDFDYFEIPRKNVIFGKWMKASMWWPDYNIRFFKKGGVVWSEKIHSNPKAKGVGRKLEEREEYAIIHHHYLTVAQFVERNSRYSKIQAEELYENGVRFKWTDLIRKPFGEFLGRFFANKGYADGIHGLALSMLQAFMFTLQYLYLWEMDKFSNQEFSLDEVRKETKKAGSELRYWFNFSTLSKNPLIKNLQKFRNKFMI